MTKEHSPDRLDVKAFAQAGAHLSGHDTLLKYKRLAEEAQGLHPDLRVDWAADGEVRTTHGVGGQVWLRLKASATLPMTCQRCLHSVDVPLEVEREFRFVADEATAEALDGDSDEDLLALSREFCSWPCQWCRAMRNARQMSRWPPATRTSSRPVPTSPIRSQPWQGFARTIRTPEKRPVRRFRSKTI